MCAESDLKALNSDEFHDKKSLPTEVVELSSLYGKGDYRITVNYDLPDDVSSKALTAFANTKENRVYVIFAMCELDVASVKIFDTLTGLLLEETLKNKWILSGDDFYRITMREFMGDNPDDFETNEDLFNLTIDEISEYYNPDISSLKIG